MDNPFSLIVLACQKAHLEGKVLEKELGEDRLTIAKALLRHKYGHDRIISFLVFLKSFLFIDNQDINRKFDELIYEVSGGTIDMGVIEVLKKQERQQGLEQGLQQGAEQKSYEVVSNLLAAGKFTDSEIANFATVTEDFVRKVRADLNKKKK